MAESAVAVMAEGTSLLDAAAAVEWNAGCSAAGTGAAVVLSEAMLRRRGFTGTAVAEAGAEAAADDASEFRLGTSTFMSAAIFRARVHSASVGARWMWPMHKARAKTRRAVLRVRLFHMQTASSINGPTNWTCSGLNCFSIKAMRRSIKRMDCSKFFNRVSIPAKFARNVRMSGWLRP